MTDTYTTAIAEARERLAAAGAIMLEDIIGPAEIVDLAGVSRKTFHMWRQLPDFPKPVRTLSIGDLYDRNAVQTWLTERRGT